MKYIVTGSTGYIGQAIIAYLIMHNLPFMKLSGVDFNNLSIKNEEYFLHEKIESFGGQKDELVLINAGWRNVKDREQAEVDIQFLGKQLRLHEFMIKFGVKNFVNFGTCYEYGIAYGPISPDVALFPTTVYGREKLSLYKNLKLLQKEYPNTNLLWLRVFYVCGGLNQNQNIFDLIKTASEGGASEFDATFGEQLIDFINVDTLVKQTIKIVESNNLNGVANACSGIPKSLRRAVEDYVAENNLPIAINFGAVNYRDFESFAMWGSDPFKLFDHG